MCLAIYKPAYAHVSRKTFMRAWSNNPDGAGFAYVANGALVVVKSTDGARAFWKLYRAAVEGPAKKSNVVIHFRYATHGAKTVENVHPFLIHSGALAVVHNGILDCDPPNGDTRSDTAYFCDTVLETLGAGFHRADAVCSVLGSLIGGRNKLILMDTTGYARIVNSAAGLWENHIWYSNRSGFDVPMRASLYKGFAGHGNYLASWEEDIYIKGAEDRIAQPILCDSCGDDEALPWSELPPGIHQRLCAFCAAQFADA